VTIFEYAKQVAECRFRPSKTREEKEKGVASAMPRSRVVEAVVDSKLVRLRTGNFQRQCHFRSEMCRVVEDEQKDKVITFERKELPCLFCAV